MPRRNMSSSPSGPSSARIVAREASSGSEFMRRRARGGGGSLERGGQLDHGVAVALAAVVADLRGGEDDAGGDGDGVHGVGEAREVHGEGDSTGAVCALTPVWASSK